MFFGFVGALSALIVGVMAQDSVPPTGLTPFEIAVTAGAVVVFVGVLYFIVKKVWK